MRGPNFDLYLVRNFFDEETCARIVAATGTFAVAPATVYGTGESEGVNERVRKAARLVPSKEIRDLVTGRLENSRSEVAEHFGVRLNSCDEPQFLRYLEGDFFVAHQDGNTGLMKLEQEERLVSVVIFLSRQSELAGDGDYSGGSLVFTEWRRRNRGKLELAGEPGTLVAFRSETTHEVTLVTHGERHSIACWYR